MNESAEKILYLKEIYFVPILLRNISHLKSFKYANSTRSSRGFTQKKSMRSC